MKTSHYLTTSIMTGLLLIGLQTSRAEEENGHQASLASGKSANALIGKKVVNAQDENLGKIHDIIIDVGAGTAPYAIIAQGGTFSPKRNRVAVPISSLSCSANGDVVLSATKEQLESATKTKTGEWATVAETDWARDVDAFYGKPASREGYTRESDRDENESRTYVRDPAPKGAELLMTPQDSALCEKICENTDLVNVRVQNGVTHLYGTVENDEARKDMEAKVRSIDGVNKVVSHLRVKNQ